MDNVIALRNDRVDSAQSHESWKRRVKAVHQSLHYLENEARSLNLREAVLFISYSKELVREMLYDQNSLA